MLGVYGLKNCDTCRKALKWLEAESIAYTFHDVKADGISAADVKRFAAAVGWEALLNKASTTWRGLPDSDKQDLTEAKAVKLMAANPSLIKRPVFEKGRMIISGFRDAQKAALKDALGK
ncbi:arsenate reductase [Parvibaculum sp.]|uniref:arsenate reductase n=1 Tax=Parvibaculum sp. TaxID=2024848 RepID=UPI003C75A141